MKRLIAGVAALVAFVVFAVIMSHVFYTPQTQSYVDGYNTAVSDNAELGVTDTGLECNWIAPAGDNVGQFAQGCEAAIKADATTPLS
jgi:hypothetical protein